jgi:hypothetical protein
VTVEPDLTRDTAHRTSVAKQCYVRVTELVTGSSLSISGCIAAGGAGWQAAVGGQGHSAETSSPQPVPTVGRVRLLGQRSPTTPWRGIDDER